MEVGKERFKVVNITCSDWEAKKLCPSKGFLREMGSSLLVPSLVSQFQRCSSQSPTRGTDSVEYIRIWM